MHAAVPLACSSGTECHLGVQCPKYLPEVNGENLCQLQLLFLDDDVVFSSTVEGHIGLFDALLDCLQQENLKAKLEKLSLLSALTRTLG